VAGVQRELRRRGAGLVAAGVVGLVVGAIWRDLFDVGGQCNFLFFTPLLYVCFTE
jgi:hypothetical protein